MRVGEFGEDYDIDILKQLSISIENKKHLKLLHINFNSFYLKNEEEAIKNFFEAIEKNKTIEDLKLKCRIYS